MDQADRIYFFGTCLIDLIFPQAGLAAMRLLRREGLTVVYPQGQTCCGQPAYNSGYDAEAQAVARRQLDAFPEDFPLVVPSASCAGMPKVQYPKLFAGTPDQERAERLAARVWELTDFLLRMLDWRRPDLGPPLRVVLHHSCSARREMGVAGAATALLSRLANLEVMEPDHAYECCGFGGTFAVKQPEISAAMAADKADAIVATASQVLVSQDCGCLMNLGGTLAHRYPEAGNPMGTRPFTSLSVGQGQGFSALGKADLASPARPPAVKHIAELLWERTHVP
jgi:L-lactate dehydrogenase complex protein LldE